MMKHVFLASAMMVAAPALAQTTTAPTQTTNVQSGTTADAAPTDAPSGAVTPAATPQAADPAAPAQAAATQPATATQVAQVVDQQFSGYDKNGDGKLSETEFAAWMVALKAQSDPATKADSPATKSWVNAAFSQADKDKSKSLSKAEVTGFLSQGQS